MSGPPAATVNDSPEPDSWRTRSLEFTDEGPSSTLGQSNRDGNPREKITQQKDWLNRGVLGHVKGIRWGTYANEKAVLLSMQFDFAFNRNAFRVRSVEISVIFRRSNPGPGPPPALVCWSPAHIFGHTTTEQREIVYELGGHLGAAAGPADAGIDANRTSTSSYAREHALEIEASPWCDNEDEDVEEYNMVIFNVRENAKSNRGVPKHINVGMVVRASQDLHAVVNVKVSALGGFVSAPWDKDDPLLLPVGVVKRDFEVSDTRFDQLSDAEWKRLVPYQEEGVTVIQGRQ